MSNMAEATEGMGIAMAKDPHVEIIIGPIEEGGEPIRTRLPAETVLMALLLNGALSDAVGSLRESGIPIDPDIIGTLSGTGERPVVYDRMALEAAKLRTVAADPSTKEWSANAAASRIAGLAYLEVFRIMLRDEAFAGAARLRGFPGLLTAWAAKRIADQPMTEPHNP